MKQYNVGEKVWYTDFKIEQVEITCPACYGKLQIKVILGNDEEVIVPCNGCERGYYGSLGYIEEYDWVRTVKQVTISQVEGKETLEGKVIESYRFDSDTGYTTPEYNRLFDTQEEAEKRADELFEQHELEKINSIKRKKENPIKTYGWHIRYHASNIRELEKKLEYHKTKLIIAKDNNKKKDEISS